MALNGGEGIMANQVLIDVMNNNKHDSGTKARNDVAYILKRLGFETTIMFNRNHNNVYKTLELFKAMRNIRNHIKENDIIVLQYPYQIHVMRMVLREVGYLRKKYKAKLIIIIHDVVYLRKESYISGDFENMKKIEIGFFNSSDGIIAHNSTMKEELISAGVNVPIYELGLFDYVYDGKPAKISKTDKATIVFAGNLSQEKSGFIYDSNNQISNPVNLYGSKPASLKINYNYMGSFPPDELIESLEGNYGLVWDGPSSNSCEGNYGNYLRFNNPHKFSLYIAAGLPVIVWKESALADFVLQHDIGVVVDSLNMLNDLPTYNSEKYQNYLRNVSRLKSKVCNGDMLKHAILNI